VSARQEADVERADWLDEGFDSAQAQFLMVTAITHHRFSSPLWGEDEVRKLHAELAEIAAAAAEITAAETSAPKPSGQPVASRLFS
jgi:hypothetical protein